MADDSIPVLPVSPKTTLGDRVRRIADQLRQEGDVQIKATSRILGAAAQMAQNHDRLIDEVVDMVEDDLAYGAQAPSPTPTAAIQAAPSAAPSGEPYTAKRLQQLFKRLSEAKAHFGLKASSWAILAEKLNALPSPPPPPPPAPSQTGSSEATLAQRLEAMELEMRAMRSDIRQILQILQNR